MDQVFPDANSTFPNAFLNASHNDPETYGCYTEGDEGEGRRRLASAVMRPTCSALESEEKEATKGEV
jgi:hypothetical protein